MTAPKSSSRPCRKRRRPTRSSPTWPRARSTSWRRVERIERAPPRRQLSMPSTPKQEKGPRKLVELDEETWAALDVLARDRAARIAELAEEAVRDPPRKPPRPGRPRGAL